MPRIPSIKEAAPLSVRYYAHLRGAPPKADVSKKLQDDLDAFKKKFEKDIAALKK